VPPSPLTSSQPTAGLAGASVTGGGSGAAGQPAAVVTSAASFAAPVPSTPAAQVQGAALPLVSATAASGVVSQQLLITQRPSLLLLSSPAPLKSTASAAQAAGLGVAVEAPAESPAAPLNTTRLGIILAVICGLGAAATLIALLLAFSRWCLATNRGRQGGSSRLQSSAGQTAGGGGGGNAAQQRHMGWVPAAAPALLDGVGAVGGGSSRAGSSSGFASGSGVTHRAAAAALMRQPSGLGYPNR
jgi:hypothetical protein